MLWLSDAGDYYVFIVRRRFYLDAIRALDSAIDAALCVSDLSTKTGAAESKSLHIRARNW